MVDADTQDRISRVWIHQAKENSSSDTALMSSSLGYPSSTGARSSNGDLSTEIIRHESLKFGFHLFDAFEPFERAGLRRLRNEAG